MKIKGVRGMRILIEPQPEWEEEPVKDGDGWWCGRYRYLRQGYDGEPEEDVDVCSIKPPNEEFIPTEIDGKWYWEKPIKGKE